MVSNLWNEIDKQFKKINKDSFPKCLAHILRQSGYDSLLSISNFKETDISGVEKCVDGNKDMLKKFTCSVSKCSCYNYKNMNTFKFLPGHTPFLRKLISLIETHSEVIASQLNLERKKCAKKPTHEPTRKQTNGQTMGQTNGHAHGHGHANGQTCTKKHAKNRKKNSKNSQPKTDEDLIILLLNTLKNAAIKAQSVTFAQLISERNVSNLKAVQVQCEECNEVITKKRIKFKCPTCPKEYSLTFNDTYWTANVATNHIRTHIRETESNRMNKNKIENQASHEVSTI